MATFTEDFARMRNEFDNSFQERREFVQGVIDHEVEDVKNRKEFCKRNQNETAAMLNSHRQWINGTLKPLVADLTAGGKIFRSHA